MPPARDRRRRDRLVLAAGAAALALAVGAFAAERMVQGSDQRHWRVVDLTHGGDPDRGREAIQRYGCGRCHTIRSVRNARGLVGPPLDGIARRVYIAGVAPNTPDAMIAWIRDPRALDAKTAMPNTGVTAEDARDIAAFLYSLR